MVKRATGHWSNGTLDNGQQCRRAVVEWVVARLRRDASHQLLNVQVGRVLGLLNAAAVAVANYRLPCMRVCACPTQVSTQAARLEELRPPTPIRHAHAS